MRGPDTRDRERAGQDDLIEPGIAHAAMAMGIVEGDFQYPGLRRHIPRRPGFARDMIAAADVADIGVQRGVVGLDVTGGGWLDHGKSIARFPPFWRETRSVMDMTTIRFRQEKLRQDQMKYIADFASTPVHHRDRLHGRPLPERASGRV